MLTSNFRLILWRNAQLTFKGVEVKSPALKPRRSGSKSAADTDGSSGSSSERWKESIAEQNAAELKALQQLCPEDGKKPLSAKEFVRVFNEYTATLQTTGAGAGARGSRKRQREDGESKDDAVSFAVPLLL